MNMTRIVTIVVALLSLASCGQAVPTAPSVETAFAGADVLDVRSGPRTEKHKFIIYDAVNRSLVSGATVTVILLTGETFTGTSANAGLVILPVGKGDSMAHVRVVMTGFCEFDDFVGIDVSHTYIGIQPGC
jgi:hypothetical protein